MAFWNDPSSIVPKKQSAWVVFFGKRTLDKSGQTKSFGEDGKPHSTNQLFVGFFKTVSKPSYQLKTTQHKYLGIHEFHYPTHVVWQPIKLTLVDGYIYDIDGAYIRNDEILWENGKLKFAKRQLVKRSAQTFFYDALREGGYTDPEEFDVDDKLARFRRTVFKNDLIGATVGQNLDFDNNNKNIDTRSWNTLDIVEYAPLLNGYKNIETIKQELSNITNIDGLSEQLSGLTKEQKLKALSKLQDSYNIERNLIYKSIQNNNVSTVKEMERWELYNPIITDVNFGELNYEQDALTNITLTVAYDWAKLTVNGDSIDTDDEVNAKITKNININTSLGNITATVRSDIDAELAKEIANGRTIPTVKDTVIQQVDQKVKEASIYKTDAATIDLDVPTTNLRNALDTTEKQIREELADIDQVARETGEVRQVVAQGLVAVEMASQLGIDRNTFDRASEVRVQANEKLSNEEREIAKKFIDLRYASVNGLTTSDESFKAEYDKALSDYRANLEGAKAVGNDAAETVGNNFVGKNLTDKFEDRRTKIIEDKSSDILDFVGQVSAFDQQRKEVVKKQVDAYARGIKLEEVNGSNLQDAANQIEEIYGKEPGFDKAKLQQEISKVQTKVLIEKGKEAIDLRTQIKRLEQQIPNLSETEQIEKTNEILKLKKDLKQTIEIGKQYDIDISIPSTPFVKTQDLKNASINAYAPSTYKNDSGLESQISGRLERLDASIDALKQAEDNIIPPGVAIPTYNKRRELDAVIASINENERRLREVVGRDPEGYSDEQRSSRTKYVRGVVADLEELRKERQALELSLQVDQSINNRNINQYNREIEKTRIRRRQLEEIEKKQRERLEAVRQQKGNR